jgi:hypothetical protein
MMQDWTLEAASLNENVQRKEVREHHLSKILSALDELDGGSAAWMAGYARVTALYPGYHRTVVASPLYVERITAPK